MFKVQKPIYDIQDLESLQERLFLLQKESFEQGYAHVFLIEGWASSGKGSILQNLTVRLDPRKFKVYSPYVHQSEDRGYPFLWNFWRVLPRYGEMLFYLNTYYSRLAYLQSKDKISKLECNQRLVSILNTERILSKDKILVHKFFIHLSKKEQKKRFKESKVEKRDWEFSPYDKDQWKHYDRYQRIFETLLLASTTSDSPWQILYNDKKEDVKLLIFESIIQKLETILGFDSKEHLSKMNSEELIP